ncbi:MAG: hypothetical protein JNL85_18400 [Rubrivivax sp.]|nr:hypothetical protein [Rubrivivax sp.]
MTLTLTALPRAVPQPAGAAFGDVQRLVLCGTRWRAARHLCLGFGDRADALRFLHALLRDERLRPSRCDAPAAPPHQASLGFTRRGLERSRVLPHVLSCFAAKAPAFFAGAPQRAASHAAASGRDAPAHWDAGFAFMRLDAVLSLHALHDDALAAPAQAVRALAGRHGVQVGAEIEAKSLPGQRVHFGYRDGLARIGIEGLTDAKTMAALKPTSKHAAGEFVLGHAQDSGANPWLSGPADRVWPAELRAFFHNGSFGVLQHIEQDVTGFEDFVARAAAAAGESADWVKGKLCGRAPNGRPLAAGDGARPLADFDYSADPEGHRCPFGSHVRRMNPRGDVIAHARSRPLLRRGMAYGQPWSRERPEGDRGLIGQFFCASIEDQYEHLLAQWGDRVPMGSRDGGGARDPLIGAHEAGDGGFEIPRPAPGQPLMLRGLAPFTRTRGIAYLFYPSLTALVQMADNRAFADLREDPE